MAPVVCFDELVETGLPFMGLLGKTTFTVHSISAQTSQEGIKCTKTKELLRAFCPNIYTVPTGLLDQVCYKFTLMGPREWSVF